MPEPTDEVPQQSKRSRHEGLAVAIAVGSGAGAAIGVVFGNIPIGVAIGAGAGVVIGAIVESSRRGH